MIFSFSSIIMYIMQEFDTVKYFIPIKSKWIFCRSGIIIIIIIIIIIMISSITVFAGALFVYQPGTNHAPRASVTKSIILFIC